MTKYRFQGRDYAARPNQANGRSSPTYGRTGPIQDDTAPPSWSVRLALGLATGALLVAVFHFLSV